MPLIVVQPGRTLKAEALTIDWEEKTDKLEQRLVAAEERYQKAWQALRASTSNN